MKSTGLVFAEKPSVGIEPTNLPDRSRWGKDGTHNSVTMVRLPSGLWVRELTGAATSYIDVGNVGQLVKAALIWLFPDDITTRSFMDLDGGTHSLEADGSGDVTATGWASPTFYVNAVPAATRLTASVWNFVVVRTATAFIASDFDVGREAAAYWDGKVALAELLSYAPSAGQILKKFNEQRSWFGV